MEEPNRHPNMIPEEGIKYINTKHLNLVDQAREIQQNRGLA